MAEPIFQFKVITPVGVVLDARVSSVTLPSSEGEIGVLPGHTRYVGLLGTGVVDYVTADGSAKKRFVISGGFGSFTDNTLTLLADSVDFADSVNRDAFARDREAALKVIQSSHSDTAEWSAAKAQLARIEALEALH